MDYQEKLRFAKEALDSGSYDKETIEYIFPELKESEDERIKNEIIAFVEQSIHRGGGTTIPEKQETQWLAWLEKQGEQKQHLELKAGHWYFCHQAYCERADVLTVKEGETFRCEEDGIVRGFIIKEPEKYFREINIYTDKVEHEFNVGDWVVPNNGEPRVFRVKERGWPNSIISCSLGNQSVNTFTLDKQYHLWSIQDAKDGDVLATPDYILIFKALLNNDFGTSYCHYDFGAGNPQFIWFEDKNWYFGKEAIIHPATKEQYDLLFSKMKEAGYEWDIIYLKILHLKIVLLK